MDIFNHPYYKFKKTIKSTKTNKIKSIKTNYNKIIKFKKSVRKKDARHNDELLNSSNNCVYLKMSLFHCIFYFILFSL